MSFYIKDLEIKKSVILAPMAGITSFSYRKFLSEFGVGATYSEMISDCGLIYNNKKTIEMMKNDSNFNRPYGIQLFGGSKESLLKGLEVIENSNIEYDFLDLNLACPVPKVTKGNGGSKWLTKLDEMYEMVKAVVEKSKKPVTAKVRLGWKSVDIEKICVLLEKAGVSFIAIHARTKEELYSGKPHFEELKNICEGLKEFNPMMGHRGCRLAVTYPEIAEMQTRAVIEAAINVNKEGMNVVPEIMIPLVGEVKELKYVKDIVTKTADKVIAEAGVELKYKVGTMIEIPRAALTADEIAKEAEFFSFGTNDLTQMTFGFSRDDAAKFLGDYYDKKIYESDPFAKLDQKGVGKLVEMAAKLGRQTRPDLDLGICGEHGGNPASVEFCHKVGLDYVSCSPFRVPIARLAAAQAAIKFPREK